MTTLITGGTGKTGRILAQLFADAGLPALLTSRKGEAPGSSFKAVKFDWFDNSTFENPFKVDSNIDRVYIVCPHVFHPAPIVKPFIDLAIAKGVKRFVLLGVSHQTSKGPGAGEFERVLEESGADYVVLKATWFQDNFGTMFLQSIREENQILSSMEDGLAPFVSTRDIAEAAFHTLTVEKLETNELLLFGPELLTNEDAVKLLSSVLGREIKYTRQSVEEMKAYLRIKSPGIPEDYLNFLVSLEQTTLKGRDKEQFEGDVQKKWIGKDTLLDYFKENRDLWVKA